MVYLPKLAKCVAKLSLAFSFFVTAAHALPALGDFDNDGLSDLGVASVDRSSGITSWLVRRSSGGPDLYYTFPIAADALVTGRFYGGGASFPGVVRVRDTAKPLEWHIKTPTGSEAVFNYGLPGDTIPNQGDLDCDGVTDLVVARNGDPKFYPGFKIWYVALSAVPGTVQAVAFGLASDRVGVADMDGDGCSELIVLRDGYQWFSRKLYGAETTPVQWGLPGDIPLLPKDLNFDGVADYIAVRPSSAGQTAYIRFSSSFSMAIPLGTASTIPMLGDFFREGPNFAWADRKNGLTSVRHPNASVATIPFGGASSVVIRPDGTVVQPTDSGIFGNTGGASDTNGVSCDKIYPAKDGKDKFVWKPISGGTPTQMSIIFPTDPYKDKLPIASVVLWHDGAIAGKAFFSGYKNPDRPTWHLPQNGKYYPNDLTVAVTLQNKQVHCINIPDPANRWD
ncbi:MAG: VCBS repeat-containing protein [Bdellovibrionota bacterium]